MYPPVIRYLFKHGSESVRVLLINKVITADYLIIHSLGFQTVVCLLNSALYFRMLSTPTPRSFTIEMAVAVQVIVRRFSPVYDHII
jgi:hypothetical protein